MVKMWKVAFSKCRFKLLDLVSIPIDCSIIRDCFLLPLNVCIVIGALPNFANLMGPIFYLEQFYSIVLNLTQSCIWNFHGKHGFGDFLESPDHEGTLTDEIFNRFYKSVSR